MEGDGIYRNRTSERRCNQKRTVMRHSGVWSVSRQCLLHCCVFVRSTAWVQYTVYCGEEVPIRFYSLHHAPSDRPDSRHDEGREKNFLDMEIGTFPEIAHNISNIGDIYCMRPYTCPPRAKNLNFTESRHETRRQMIFSEVLFSAPSFANKPCDKGGKYRMIEGYIVYTSIIACVSEQL